MGGRSELVLPNLALSEWAVLALIAEGPTHGFAVTKQLAAHGDLGRIWTVSKPVVYRSMSNLGALGLIEDDGDEPGAGGPPRSLRRITPHGLACVEQWLRTPVAHVRDLRTQLLLQLCLRDRAGLPLAPLATEQLVVLRPIVDALVAESEAESPDPFPRLVARWRSESAKAAVVVLEDLVGHSGRI